MKKGDYKKYWRQLVGSYAGAAGIYYLLSYVIGFGFLGGIFFFPMRFVPFVYFDSILLIVLFQGAVLTLFWGTIAFRIARYISDRKVKEVL